MLNQQTSKGIVFKVKVLPNSNAFEVLGFDSWQQALRIRVQSPAIEGQANQELEKKLSKFLETKIEIIQGHTSTQKIVRAETFSKPLSQLFLKTNSK
ncbi:MAG: DUF167 domain-containing protein [Candidatus Diapherotrites archaeon]|nr:DUF167 domain-containing protein [Candidatus Diapherotrites archaeon]